MSAKIFVDPSGKYIGEFSDGAIPPNGSIEVSTRPTSGTFSWSGSAWVEPSNWYAAQREDDYPRSGSTEKAMIVALWEKVVENRPQAADALQVKRDAVKGKFPKPK